MSILQKVAHDNSPCYPHLLRFCESRRSPQTLPTRYHGSGAFLIFYSEFSSCRDKSQNHFLMRSWNNFQFLFTDLPKWVSFQLRKNNQRTSRHQAALQKLSSHVIHGFFRKGITLSCQPYGSPKKNISKSGCAGLC